MNALPRPAFILVAHLGSVSRDGQLESWAHADAITVDEIRVDVSGWTELVHTCGLKEAGLLLTIAGLSRLEGGQLVCTATSEEEQAVSSVRAGPWRPRVNATRPAAALALVPAAVWLSRWSGWAVDRS